MRVPCPLEASEFSRLSGAAQTQRDRCVWDGTTEIDFRSINAATSLSGKYCTYTDCQLLTMLVQSM